MSAAGIAAEWITTYTADGWECLSADVANDDLVFARDGIVVEIRTVGDTATVWDVIVSPDGDWRTVLAAAELIPTADVAAFIAETVAAIGAAS